MDDLISRQSVLDLVDKGFLVSNGNYRSVRKFIEGVPSAEKPKGKWVLHGEPPWKVRECSECGEKWHHWTGDALPNFCGNCGAEMERD